MKALGLTSTVAVQRSILEGNLTVFGDWFNVMGKKDGFQLSEFETEGSLERKQGGQWALRAAILMGNMLVPASKPSSVELSKLK